MEAHVNDVGVLAGLAVAVSCSVPPIPMVPPDGETETDFTGFADWPPFAKLGVELSGGVGPVRVSEQAAKVNATAASAVATSAMVRFCMRVSGSGFDSCDTARLAVQRTRDAVSHTRHCERSEEFWFVAGFRESVIADQRGQ